MHAPIALHPREHKATARQRVGLSAMLCATAIPLTCLWSACAAPPMVIGASLQAAQAGSDAYSKGTVESAYAVSFERVLMFAEAVMKDNGFKPVYRVDQPLYAYLVYEDLMKDHVQIRVYRKTPTISLLKVRAGFWGEQSIAVLLQQLITRRLNAPATQPL